MPVLVCGCGSALCQAEALPVAAKGAGSTNNCNVGMFVAQACWQNHLIICIGAEDSCLLNLMLPLHYSHSHDIFCCIWGL